MTYRDPGDDRANKTWRRVKLGNGGAMDMTLDIFDAPAPSVPRPTSEDAGDKQTRSKRQTDRTRILKHLSFHHDGLTRDQIADTLALSPNTVRQRIVELVTLGLVHDSRLTRLTQTGSSAAVCEVTDAGRQWLRTHRTPEEAV